MFYLPPPVTQRTGSRCQFSPCWAAVGPWLAAAATGAGVLAMAVGLFTGLDALLPLGQALMWLSLGSALLYLVGQLPRRREGRTFGLRPVDDDDEDIGHDDVAAT